MPRSKSTTGHLQRHEVFDEVDEFHLQNDKIMLDVEEERRTSDHELSDVSEVDVLEGLDPSSSEYEEDYGQNKGFGMEEYLAHKADEDAKASRKAIPKATEWGVTSKEYYGQEEQALGSTFDLEKAVEEQEEVEELRKLRLQGSVEADFIDNELAHTKGVLDPEGAAEDEARKRAERLASLPEEERTGLIAKTSAELPGLLNEFKQVVSRIRDLEKLRARFDDTTEAQIVELRKSRAGKQTCRKCRRTVEFLHRTATAYAGCLAFYLTLQVQGVLVRSHPVFERIIAYKTAFWRLEGDTIDEAERLFRGEAKVVKKKKKRKRGKVKNVLSATTAVLEPEQDVGQTKKRVKGGKPTDAEWENRMGHYKDAIPEDGKRMATRQILRNRGLMRYRKWEHRHSRLKIRARHGKRVKARKYRFKEYKEKRTEYDGEVSGIRTNLTRSAKFKIQNK